MLRNAHSAGDELETLLAGSNHDFSDLKVPYTITFPVIMTPQWEAMKKVPTGVFNQPYEKDVEGTTIDPQDYKQARLLVEFCLGEPLGAFSQDERNYVLDQFKSMLDKKNYQLSGVSSVQVALSREHSKELEDAVETAARATGKEFAPHLEAARNVDQGRRLGS